MDRLDKLADGVAELLERQEMYREKITQILNHTIANFGSSAKVSAKYIISTLIEKQNRDKK